MLAQGAPAPFKGVALIVKDAFIRMDQKMDQRAHPCKKLRFEYINKASHEKSMGYAPPEHRRFRYVVSYFYYCILLKKHGFKDRKSVV